MEHSKMKSFTGKVQMRLKINKDFPRKLQQHLVLKSSSVNNPFQFIVKLFTEGVLSDGSSDPEASFGLKEMMVQLAMMMSCSKGADAFGGLMKALEGSGNLELIPALRTWVEKEFGIDTNDDLSEPKGGASVVGTRRPKKWPKKGKSSREMNSSGTKLIDKIISQVDEELMEKLEGHLVGKASQVLDAPQMCSHLVHQNVLDQRDYQLKTTPKAQRKDWAGKAIKAACSKRALGSLVRALQSSGNESILAETYEWLATSTLRKNSTIAVKTPANQRSKEVPKFMRSRVSKHVAPSDGLSKIATFKWQRKSATTGISFVQFDKERMMACSADGALKVCNAQGKAEEKVATKADKITCFQYDEEVLLLGTAAGTAHLFDGITFEEKTAVKFNDPVHSLKFDNSALLILTRSVEQEQMWWMEISRPYMQLVNPKSVFSWKRTKNQVPGVCMCPDISFVHRRCFVHFLVSKSGRLVLDENDELCSLLAPANISSLSVIELISTKIIVLAGCIDGSIAMWNVFKWTCDQSPARTFRWHTEAIISLCSLNGHLLSLDKSGKLLMWSGHNMEDNGVSPVPRVLDENFSNVTSLTAHDRWFSSCSFNDGFINIWTLPDSWFRTN